MPLNLPSLFTLSIALGVAAAQNASEAYIYGYAPIAVLRARNEQFCSLNGTVPVNELISMGQLVTPFSTPIVAPNVDTLYGAVWMDLRSGPVVIGIPKTEGRYHVFQVMDFYTNTFAEIGSRTQGYGDGQHVILPPGWNETLSENITSSYLSPTWDAWVLVRTLVYNSTDLPAAQSLQAGYSVSVLPNSAPPDASPTLPAPFNCTSPPPVDDLTSAGAEFFDELAAVLLSNPPPAADSVALTNLAALGVTPGSHPSDGAYARMLATGIAQGEATLRRAITAAASGGEGAAGGWTSNPAQGTYGTDYLERAAIAKIGLGANVPEEARYYQLQPAGLERPVFGNETATLVFECGSFPPVLEGGFWSVTAYGGDSYLYDNAEDRYAVSSHQSDLAYSSDGSLTVYFGHDVPSGLNASDPRWLPTPEGAYVVIVRAYTPAEAIDKYAPPALTLAQAA